MINIVVVVVVVVGNSSITIGRTIRVVVGVAAVVGMAARQFGGQRRSS